MGDQPTEPTFWNAPCKLKYDTKPNLNYSQNQTEPNQKYFGLALKKQNF